MFDYSRNNLNRFLKKQGGSLETLGQAPSYTGAPAMRGNQGYGGNQMKTQGMTGNSGVTAPAPQLGPMTYDLYGNPVQQGIVAGEQSGPTSNWGTNMQRWGRVHDFNNAIKDLYSEPQPYGIKDNRQYGFAYSNPATGPSQPLSGPVQPQKDIIRKMMMASRMQPMRRGPRMRDKLLRQLMMQMQTRGRNFGGMR